MEGSIIVRLQQIFGKDRVLTNKTDLMTYSYDASFATQLAPKEPEIVVIAQSTEQVAECMRIANEYKIPVFPRGAGTAQTGGPVPTKHGTGIVIDLSKMNGIIEIDAKNMQVVIEPGVIQANLNLALKEYGVFFPPDPGSAKMCTIGGMVANNSSGLRAVKYGNTRFYVLGLEVVLPTGDVIVTGGAKSKALKSVSGYDLAHLMIGSEGTLGIVTRLRLKVLPLPKTRGIIVCSFSKLEHAGEAVNHIFRSGVLPSAIEIMDSQCTKAANLMRPDLALPENEALLVIEVDGSKEEVASQVKRVTEVVHPFTDFIKFSDEPEECQKLWQARQIVRNMGILRLFPVGLREMEAVLPAVPAPHERKAHPVFSSSEKSGTGERVAMFQGCIMDVLFRQTNEHTIKLLNVSGFDVITPAEQVCCGALHAHNGGKDTAKELAKKNIRAFKATGAKYIISNAGGCGAMLREYEELFRDDPEWLERGKQFSKKVRDVSEVIVKEGQLPGASGNGERITFQPSCHLQYVMGVKDAPQKLLGRVENMLFVELPDAKYCCGSAGIYNMLQPDLAGEILDKKMSNVKKTASSIIITANPGCLLQMKMGIARQNRSGDMEAVHIVDYLMETIDQGQMVAEEAKRKRA